MNLFVKLIVLIFLVSANVEAGGNAPLVCSSWRNLLSLFVVPQNEESIVYNTCELLSGISPSGIDRLAASSQVINAKLEQVNQTYLGDASFVWKFLISLWLSDHQEIAYKIANQFKGSLSPKDSHIKVAIETAWSLMQEQVFTYYGKPKKSSFIEDPELALQSIEKMCDKPNDVLVILLFPRHYNLIIKCFVSCSQPESFAWYAWNSRLAEVKKIDHGLVLQTSKYIPAECLTTQSVIEELGANSPKTLAQLKLYAQFADGVEFIDDYWRLTHAIGGIRDDTLKSDVVGIFYKVPKESRDIFTQQITKLMRVIGGMKEDLSKKFMVQYVADLFCPSRSMSCRADFVDLACNLVPALEVSDENFKVDLVGALRPVPCDVGAQFVDENKQLISENAIKLDENKVKLTRCASDVDASVEKLYFLAKLKLFRFYVKDILSASGIKDEQAKLVIADAVKEVVRNFRTNVSIQGLRDVLQQFSVLCADLLRCFSYGNNASKALAIALLSSVPYELRADWTQAITEFFKKFHVAEPDLMLESLVPNQFSTLKIEDTKSFLGFFSDLLETLRIDDNEQRLFLLKGMLTNTNEFAPRMSAIASESNKLFNATAINRDVVLKTKIVVRLYQSSVPTARLKTFIDGAINLCAASKHTGTEAVSLIDSVFDKQGREFTVMKELTDSYLPANTRMLYG